MQLSRLLTLKNLSLIAVLGAGAWALMPERKEPAGAHSTGGKSGSSRPYVITMAPRFYTPGTMPGNSRKPLEALNVVRDKFEALFPDTHIEYVDVPGGMREWLVTQLSGSQAPDIMEAEVEDVWQDVQKGWYVALDRYLEEPNPFVPAGEPGSRQWWDQFKYQHITRGKAGPDGKMYCIILDMVETGIFYNKRIFAELGLEPPQTWSEFIAIHRKLRDAGYIPMLGNIYQMSDWGIDLVFDQFYDQLLSGIDLAKDPLREQYLQGYLDWDEIAFLYRKGFFTHRDNRYREVFRILKEWRQYWNQDIGAFGVDVVRMFITQKGAMIWNSSMFVQYLVENPDLAFEWGVFYPPPLTSEDSPYADGHPMCVIGGAAAQYEVTNSAFKDTGNPETSERLKRVIAFLQFLTVPENAERVVNEPTFFLPNVIGAEPKQVLQPFDEYLRKRYTTTKWSYTFDLRFNEVMVRMLEVYVNNGVSEDEFLEWMERNLAMACDDVVRRKHIRLGEFETKWVRLAPVRESIKDLPGE